jgi:hypothetical protein
MDAEDSDSESAWHGTSIFRRTAEEWLCGSPTSTCCVIAGKGGQKRARRREEVDALLKEDKGSGSFCILD